jgi:hypothetical protein
LIDVPPDFYYEEIQFQDPDEISEKFSELEEKNLFLIRSRQEVEQSLEELKNKERQMKKELTQKKIVHEEKLKELEENEKGYYEIMKGKRVRFDVSKPGSKNKDNENQDISVLLEHLRERIEQVYKITKSDKIDLTAKGTIDMLSEIETMLDSKITELIHLREINEGDIKKAENARKAARKEKKLKDTIEHQRKEILDKQERAKKLEKAKDSTDFKSKALMTRSKKKSIKKKEVKQVVNQELEEKKRYIGDIF